MAMNGYPMGGAVDALGLGDVLAEQVANETEEMRRKRLREAQERSLMGSTGSLATSMLFGRSAPMGTGGMRGLG